MEIFKDWRRARRQSDRGHDRANCSEESKGAIIAEEDDEQSQNAQTVAHSLEFGFGPGSPAPERHRDFGRRETFVYRLDRKLDFQFESPRKHRNVLIKAA